MRAFTLTLPVTVLLALAASPLGGQERDAETAALQRATALEARGRYQEARAVLEDLLGREPGSSGALFSLERVLRPLGEVRAVLPWADRFLAVEPRSSGGRYLKLRVLAEIDSLTALEPAVDAWIAAEPGSPEPYREGARLLEERLGAERALELLARGRADLGSPDALALETGDMRLKAGDAEAAGREWARAVQPDGGGAADVLRRLTGLDESAGQVASSLLDGLDEEPTTPARRRAGVGLALAAGRAERALELAERVVPALRPVDRKGFLAELGRLAERAGLPSVELWAFRALRKEAESDTERRALDRRIAATALAAGDTTGALEAQVRVARALEPGSPERRRVVSDLVRVEAASSSVDAETLLRRLEGFRAEFPDAPELDVLASAVAAGLRARGRGEAAVRVLEDVRGPRSALERAYLLFEDRAVEEGKEALLAAVPGLEPARATEVIQLASALDRLSPPGAALLSRTASLAHRGRVDEALEAVGEGMDALPPDDRPAVLAHAARAADAGGRPAEAARLRERLLEGHPEAPQAAEATLALARWRSRRPEGVDEAARLLEALILERPGDAIVPAARRELARLRGGSAGGGNG